MSPEPNEIENKNIKTDIPLKSDGLSSEEQNIINSLKEAIEEAKTALEESTALMGAIKKEQERRREQKEEKLIDITADDFKKTVEDYEGNVKYYKSLSYRKYTKEEIAKETDLPHELLATQYDFKNGMKLTFFDGKKEQVGELYNTNNNEFCILDDKGKENKITDILRKKDGWIKIDEKEWKKTKTLEDVPVYINGFYSGGSGTLSIKEFNDFLNIRGLRNHIYHLGDDGEQVDYRFDQEAHKKGIITGKEVKDGVESRIRDAGGIKVLQIFFMGKNPRANGDISAVAIAIKIPRGVDITPFRKKLEKDVWKKIQELGINTEYDELDRTYPILMQYMKEQFVKYANEQMEH